MIARKYCPGAKRSLRASPDVALSTVNYESSRMLEIQGYRCAFDFSHTNQETRRIPEATAAKGKIRKGFNVGGKDCGARPVWPAPRMLQLHVPVLASEYLRAHTSSAFISLHSHPSLYSHVLGIMSIDQTQRR